VSSVKFQGQAVAAQAMQRSRSAWVVCVVTLLCLYLYCIYDVGYCNNHTFGEKKYKKFVLICPGLYLGLLAVALSI
jgi:hypothetical protein